MLKVVGASWLQTRISTYILVTVALLGIGAIILGEFGHVEKDGTYAATMSWNHKGGYRIDFWGQGNDLTAIPLNAARAYYKTGIFETGWSILEIETSAKYPDIVQAYAAGFLEGSLTWQLIHHHWYNTVRVTCEKRPVECRKLTQYLRENTAMARQRAELLESTDPFWHMIRMYYAQLDGLEAGWKFAVRRSRQTAELESHDFLWLAMAADLPDFQHPANETTNSQSDHGGMIFLKMLARENSHPVVTVGHNTVAPYAKMLRLLKKYTFNYHLLSTPTTATKIPSRSVVMSSYPGALSSHDEFYLVIGEKQQLIVTGTSLSTESRNLWNLKNLMNQVLSPVRVMAANRLAIDGRSWSEILAFHNSGTSIRQWITFDPRSSNVWLIEQSQDGTRAVDYTNEFTTIGALVCTGTPYLREVEETAEFAKEDYVLKKEHTVKSQENITTLEDVRRFMRQRNQEEPTTDDVDQNFNGSLQQSQTRYKGVEKTRLPLGIIDTKVLVTDIDGLQHFEALSGPVLSKAESPFQWSKTFPNVSHMGHPDVFNFASVTPSWVWI